MDIFVGIPSLLVVLVTVYRIPKILAGWNNFRRSLITEAAEALTTVSAYACALLVYVTLWRIRYLRDQLNATAGHYYWNWKRVYYFQAAQVLCDLLLIPFLPFLIVGPWRIKELWNEQFAPAPSTRVGPFKTYSQVYAAMRVHTIYTTGEIILDYLCFLVVLLIVVTVVRIPTLWRAVKHRKDESETFRDSFVRTFREEMATPIIVPAPHAPTHHHAPTPASAAGGDVDARVRAAKENLAGMTQAVLKEMLRKNDQAYSGLTTKELIDKVADQQVRGKIPRCPTCFAGKLRFQNRTYRCPGYADDEGRFHRCSFTASEGDVVREPWV